MNRLLCCAIFAGMLTTGTAQASSDEAWEEFREDIDKACRALLDVPATAEIRVETDPFGTESYGVALLTVRNASEESRQICIYDKASGKAELTGAL